MDLENFEKLDISTDIKQDEIPRYVMNFILNYEEGLVTLDELSYHGNRFIEEELYNYTESVARSLKAIKVIFKTK